MKQRAAGVIGVVLALGVGTSALAQDAARGEVLFKKCKSCHMIGEDSKNKTGPVLTGVVGRSAGTALGFAYSASMTEAGAAGLVWSNETLNGYLQHPTNFLREVLDSEKVRAKMSFRLKSEQDRRDVIAYLSTFSPETSASAGGAVCVRNKSEHAHYFAAETSGATRVFGRLDPGATLCSPAGDGAGRGVVSVYEDADGFEGCSRLVAPGMTEDMLRYVDFDRCFWASNS